MSWVEAARHLGPGRDLGRLELLDHMPAFLDELAAFVDDVRAGNDPRPSDELPQIHALERLDEGYDLAEVVAEYGALRTCLCEIVVRENAPAMRSVEMPRLHQAIDKAISTSVVRFTLARERTLKALDRISTAALAHPDVGEFLDETLQVLLETTAAVDSVSVLLLEQGALRVRASAGLARRPSPEAVVRVGECLSGRIAETREPLFARDCSTDPRVTSDVIAREGTHAIYGVPLLLGTELIGVALMGSRTTFEFSQEDQLLFRTMAARATALIVQGQLREREHELRLALERDIASRKAAEAERELVRERLAAVLRALPVGVVLAEAPSGKVIMANDAFERMAGPLLPVATLAGYAAYHGSAPDGHRLGPRDWPLARAVAGANVSQQEIHFTRADGTRVITEQAAAPIRDASGAIVAAVVTVVDVTASKRAQQELQQGLRFRDEIMAVLSHDLRTPLMVTMTSAEVLERRGDLNEKQARIVTRIRSSGERMEHMIRDLLDYSRARHGGGMTVTLQNADLNAVCQQAIDAQQTLHPESVFRLVSPGSAQGRFDPDRLAQVAQNLLTNAARHAGKTPIEVRLRSEPDCLVLEVHNGGPAISPSMLPLVFEPFRRGLQSEGGSSAGLGLGLYIVQAIVSAHGGTVEVRSSEKSGTSFQVRLPQRTV